MTVGVVYDPWPARRGHRLRRYRTMVEFKANPRDAEYMRALFAQRYPEGTLAGADSVPTADRIVLLYPDAIGLGWRQVERAMRHGAPGAELRALNGRRRDFVIDRRTRRQLAVRRLLETALVGEALATAVFVLLTPPLLAWDLLSGRR